MSTPAGLLAAALLFWGQQTGLWPAAAALAALFEGSRFVGRRWDLSRADYSRISDLSALLFAGMVVYLLAQYPYNRALLLLLTCVPLTLAPLLAAQLYSAQGEVDVRALFVSMRGQPAEPRWTIDLSYPFLIVCLMSAGAANRRTPLFMAGSFALIAWALWRARSRGGSVAAWIGLVAAAGLLGAAGQAGLYGLQGVLTNEAIALFFGGRVRLDADQSVTAIGHIGALKQSSRIVLRLEPAPGRTAPRLLRGAVYNFYSAGAWHAWDAGFFPAAETADGAWVLDPSVKPAPEAAIALYLERGASLLPLPAGAARVGGLIGGSISRNRLGAVKLEDGPSLAAFSVESSGGAAGPPDPRDLQLPPDEIKVLTGLARGLELDARRPERAVERLSRYFADGFSYSIYRQSAAPLARALDEFLLKTHSGHCEHFATAAVLLLRAAGVPARYVAGYSLQEYSPLERAWIARDRHAHAWALAYVDGRWVDFDATPSSWGATEAARGSAFERVEDLAAWASFRFSRWRWSQARRKGLGPVRWLLIAVIAFFALKWLRELWTAQRGALGAAAAAPEIRPGMDSAWYETERRLEEAGFVRHLWETPAAFVARLSRLAGSGVDVHSLNEQLRTHYRRRFDPEFS